MLQHVSIWEALRRGSLKCGGEHYFEKKSLDNVTASVA